MVASISIQEIDFNNANAVWDDIMARTTETSIFQTFRWQKLWLEHFRQDASLIVLQLEKENSPIGIAPMMVSNKKLSFIGSTDVFDYRDFIGAHHLDLNDFDAIIERLKDWDWDEINLQSIPEDSPTYSILPGLLESLGMAVVVKEEDVAPISILQSDWDGYVSELPRKYRHELRRKIRRIERSYDLVEQEIVSEDHSDEDTDEFLELMKSSSSEKLEFLTPAREQFFREMVKLFSASGDLKMHFLKLDGNRVASCIAFDYGSKYLLYNSGFNPSYYSDSVGLINKAYCIRQAINDGRQTFDFLRGAERYKYDLGAENRSLFEIVARR